MNYISFAAFDDLQLAHERNAPVNLEWFRAETTNEECSEESARVLLTANDGNDYAIIETVGAESFWFLAITNRTDGLGDFIAFQEFKTYREALMEMLAMSVTDYEG